MKARWLLLATLGALMVGMMALAGTAWATGGGGGAPIVVRTVPEDGAINADRLANIKVKFSEAMKARSINTETFALYGPCGPSCGEEPFTIRYNATTRTAILDPTFTLTGAPTKYTVVVEGTGDEDGKAVKDSGGTAMATDYTFSFTTELAPCVTC